MRLVTYSVVQQLSTPTGKRTASQSPTRYAHRYALLLAFHHRALLGSATQRPKIDQRVTKPPPPPPASAQPSLPTTPVAPQPPASLESPKPSVPRPSRWDPTPDYTTQSAAPTLPVQPASTFQQPAPTFQQPAPTFQQPPRSPAEVTTPNTLVPSWSHPRHSPSYPSSVGRSSAGSTPTTDPLPHRRPEQSFPVSPPRRPSRFAPPVSEMGLSSHRGRGSASCQLPVLHQSPCRTPRPP